MARVIARHDGRQADGPACPSVADFVLHISEHRPAFDEDGDGSVPRGYACMRNLEPPTPATPAAGAVRTRSSATASAAPARGR